MKKFGRIVACSALLLGLAVGASSCKKKTYELAVVTDVGLLMDGGFNQGTYEGVKNYAEANKITYQYYQPANGADATDEDRVEAMRNAIKNGAKVIVTPGFLQESAIRVVANENPDVKFLFVDGYPVSKVAGGADVLNNVTGISYKEQESGYLAGYAAVKEGYTSLGGTFGGGGSNPACNRFAYGYVQGAKAAAAEKSVNVSVKISYQHGSSFSASTELQTQISGWYQGGTQVVFACGGSMVQSVLAAANLTQNGKVIGVDVDQSSLSNRVITSAVKGLAASVEKVLGQYYAGEWNSLGGGAQQLGAADDATGLPTATWSMTNFTKAQYDVLYAKIKNGTVTPLSNVADNCNVSTFWTALSDEHTTVSFE